MFNLSNALLNLDGRAIATVTTDDSIRYLFVEPVTQDMKRHDTGMSLDLMITPPQVTSKRGERCHSDLVDAYLLGRGFCF